MADDSAEISPGLLENVQLAIRNNIELSFVKRVKLEFKGDRTEVRILALSSHRLYLLTNSRNGCKVDSSMHILEIHKIESSKPLLVTITYGDKPLYLRVAQPKDCSEIIAHIVASLKSNFPSGNPDRLLRLVFGPPEESDARQAHVTTLVNNLKNAEGDTEIGPCGSFSKVYVSMCDLYGYPHLEEVVWDIDTIYLSLNTRELNIQDFDHLDYKDLVPLIAALEFNDWFTKVSCSSFKLGSEVCDAIIRVIKKSSTLEELVLDGVSLGRDQCQKLALSLTSNPKTSLNSLSLTGNSVEDRGVIHLSGALGKLPHGLVSLSLGDNSITSKGASTLGQALRNNKYNESSLKKLDLCKNPLKGEGVHSLCDFLSKPNMLAHLDLSSTECPLDLLFGALIRGCAQHLSSIHLAGNSFTSKKTKDSVVPASFKQFFSSSQALKFLDVSDCKLHADAVRAILEGLQENSVVTGVELNLSKNDLRGPGAKAIADNMGNLRGIARLDISDNGFEMDLIIILNKLSSNKYLKHLNLGQNSKQRSSAAVMESLVQLISFENSQLESISLADSRLKQDIIPILDALGTNETLKELDISGNQMGDEGARILAKALQINTKLRTLHWDRNGTTFRGFADIAAALECNHILLSMPMPLYDAAQSLKPQTEQNIRKIEKLLLRNQSPHKVVTEQAYRLQQGLLLTSTNQQMADRLVVQLQDLMSGLRHSKDPDVQNEVKNAKLYVQDADKLKQLLLKFHLCTNDSDIEARFAALADDFYQAAQDKMKGNMDKMIECAKEVCPHITSSEDVQDRLQSVVEGKSRLSQTFVEEIILTQAAAGIANRLSEDKLTVASVMADAIMEMVIRQLENSVTKLQELLHKGHLNRVDRNEKENAKSVEEDDVASVARKARNRLSSVQLMGPAVDGTDEKPIGGRSHKRRPTVNRRPSPGVTIPEEQDGTLREVVATVQAAPKPAVQMDFVDMEPKASELRHLVKDRARPPQKRRLPTRPSNRPAVTNGSADDEETKEENIEVFWSRPATESEEATSTKTPSKKPKSKSPSPTTTPPVKTAPPRPAPKPKTPLKPREEESKKSWIPKGGINFNVPGFLKKKAHRERSHTGIEQTDERPPSRKLSAPSWYNSDGKEVEKTPEKREPAKVVPTVAGVPSEEKPMVLEENLSSTQKPVVFEEKVPFQEKAPPEKKQTSPLEGKPERSPSGAKPEGIKPSALGLKPFVLPRERATSSTALKAPSSQPRERAATGDAPLSNPAPKEPVRPHGPPKFGVGIGGVAGGGLLAEMKMRQERAGSFGRDRIAEKKAEAKTDEVDVAATRRLVSGGKEAEAEVTKEGLVKPSSFKRPRLPSGPPPKPAPRPDRKDTKKAANAAEKCAKDEEKVDERKDRIVLITGVKGGKDGEKVEKVQESKKEYQDNIKDKQTEEVQGTNQEEQKKRIKQDEKKEASATDQEEGKKNLKEEQEVKNSVKEHEQLKDKEDEREEETKEAKDVLEGKEHINDHKIEKKDIIEAKETKQDTVNESAGLIENVSVDDLWIKRPSGQESLRPGGRSQSVKLQRSTSGSEKIPAVRSATLPKPWSPGEAPASTLARKLSWEMPKDGVKGGRKERHESKGEAPIQEDSEDQTSITSAAAAKQKENSEGEQTKLDSNAETDIDTVQTEGDKHGTVSALPIVSSPLNETQL